MPGLRLTAPQVERLCGADRITCKAVLDALVDAKFLRVSPDGTYTRLTDGWSSRPRPAKADHVPAPARTSPKHGLALPLSLSRIPSGRTSGDRDGT